MKNLKVLSMLSAIALLSTSALGQASFSETGTGAQPSNNNLVMGGNASLTAATGIDPVDSGYIRFTDMNNGQSGYVYLNQAIPATTSFSVDFEFESWGISGGADGISLFLFDGSIPPASFQPGGNGGSLGYAEADSNICGFNSTALTGGYVGVGFDDYGTYGSQLTTADAPGLLEIPNNVTIRGRAADHTSILSSARLSTLTYIKVYNDGGLGPASRPAQQDYSPKAHVVFQYNNSLGRYEVTVSIQQTLGTPLIQVLGPTLLDVPPASLKVGFAGSTGIYNAVHEIRNIIVTPISVPLSLQLISFSGNRKNNSDNLAWTTTAEKKFSHFEIEHSTDGNLFVTQGRINAAQDIAPTHSYYFSCTANELHYYRLKMVDIDGRFTYSNVIKLDNSSQTSMADGISINSIYPTPFDDVLHIKVSAENETPGTISIFDVSGKTVQSMPAIFKTGTQTYSINGLKQLISGNYFLRLTTNDQTITKNIIK